MKMKMEQPNMKKKDPSGVVYLDLINTKFKDYHGQPFLYLMKMWRELYYDCCFWVFLLEHYRYHIHGHDKYHLIRENRSAVKIQKQFRKIDLKKKTI